MDGRNLDTHHPRLPCPCHKSTLIVVAAARLTSCPVYDMAHVRLIPHIILHSTCYMLQVLCTIQ